MPVAAAAPTRRQVLALLLLVLFVYLPSVGNGFPLDDQPLAESVQREFGQEMTDPVVGEWRSPLFYFSHHYWHPHQPAGALYRPVTVWSFALTYNLIGRWLPQTWEAFPHHLVNVLLHGWATWLVLQLVLTLGVSARTALLTAALFGLHAIHSEVVASIVGRAELFAFCFGAQALLLFVRGGTLRTMAAATLLFLAACSKESALAWFPFLPCYLLAHAWTRDPSLGPWQVLRPGLGRLLLVLGVPLLVWTLARWAVVGGNELKPAFSMNELAFVSTETRILTAIKIWGYGLYKCLAPFSLACIYSAMVFRSVQTPLDPGFMAAAAALLVFLFLGLRYARRAPLLFLAMAVFLGFSFVTSNVPIAIGTVFGERVYYAPSLGICLLPALLLPRLWPHLQRVLMLLLLVWTAVCCLVISQRNFVWRTDATLFLNDVKVQPDSIDLHRKAAAIYMRGEQKDLDKALDLLNDAVELNPKYPLAWLDIGDILREQRKWQQAIAAYQRVLESPYVEPSGAAPFAHAHIGAAWIELKNLDKALAAFQSSLAAEPRNKLAYTGIGKVHVARGEIRQAVTAFQEAVRFGPRYREAWMELCLHGAEALPPVEVQKFFEHGLQLFPGDPKMALFLGGMGCQAGLDPARVAQVLQWAISNLPQSERTADNTYIAKLYYAHTLERLQRLPAARSVYGELAADPACPQEFRNKARERLDALRRQRQP
ncbi:MAG: tetratricopeptide repeat protein [Planctomycetota bacterium]